MANEVEMLRQQLADSEALVDELSAENAAMRAAAGGTAESPAEPPQRGDSGDKHVICVGDVHGNSTALAQLWLRLGDRLGVTVLHQTPVIFLGDYCDRGPDTAGVIDWLLTLRQTHGAPVTFIAGNHDFGMSAFLGCLPIDGPPPFDLETTKNPAFELYDPRRDQITYWPHAVEGGMHYLGRRWAQGAVYTARPTMESYGLKMRKGYGEKGTGKDDSFLPPELREEFIAAVPAEHKQFLAELRWVHEQPVDWGGVSRLICVHAGLDGSKPIESQMEALRARDLAMPSLYSDKDQDVRERVIAFTEREDVWAMPAELEGTAVLVSGHHGISFAEGDRIILDRSGGKPESLGKHPLEAIILPERTVIGHDGSVRSLTPQADPVGVKRDEKDAKANAKKAL